MCRVKLLLVVILLSNALLCGSVRHLRVPQDGVSPDVALGPEGKVYLVFAQGKNALFAISKDGGKTFSRVVRLNPLPGTVLGGRERGPKIAVSSLGAIHVVWMSSRSDQLYYTRKDSSGEAFSPPRNLLDAVTTIDGPTVAADAAGNVLVAWLDARLPEDRQNPLSLPLYWAASRDEGLTFSANKPAQESQLIRACSCCALKLATGREGEFFMGFRGAYHNIRDLFVARLSILESNPKVSLAKVSELNWEFNACPMSGPWITVDARRRIILAAGMSREKVYYVKSRDNGAHFQSTRYPFTTGQAVQNHPIVLSNQKGEEFFAWEEARNVRWQITDSAGAVLKSGEAGTLPGSSKATGFVDAEGNFCLVF